MMYVSPADNAALQGLFAPDLPNSPALWAVLVGHHPGKAVVDHQLHPAQCVLRTDAALSYYGQQTSQSFLDDAITHFRKRGPVWLVWPHSTSCHPPAMEEAEVVQRLMLPSPVPISLKRARGVAIRHIGAVRPIIKHPYGSLRNWAFNMRELIGFMNMHVDTVLMLGHGIGMVETMFLSSDADQGRRLVTSTSSMQALSDDLRS